MYFIFPEAEVFSRALSLIFCQIKTHETKANILSQYSTSHLIVLDIWRYILYILLEVTVSRELSKNFWSRMIYHLSIDLFI